MAVVHGEGTRRWLRVAPPVVASLLLLAVLAQALLPRVAADRVRSRVERYGSVRSVHVSAFPAVELLWGHADSVDVSAGTLAATPAQIGALLWEARNLGTLDLIAKGGVLRAPQLPAGLAVSDVRLRKRGSAVIAVATLTQEQLDAALPSGFRVQPVASEASGGEPAGHGRGAGPGGGGAVVVRASGGLFGVQASLTATVRAAEGDLIAEPRGLPFGGIARVTLFSDPHLKVAGVSLRVAGRSPLVYGVAVWGSLR